MSEPRPIERALVTISQGELQLLLGCLIRWDEVVVPNMRKHGLGPIQQKFSAAAAPVARRLLEATSQPLNLLHPCPRCSAPDWISCRNWLLIQQSEAADIHVPDWNHEERNHASK
jgi:hypothetical protein